MPNVIPMERPQTRQVLVPYQRIDSLKLTEVVDPKIFAKLGFEGTLPKQ